MTLSLFTSLITIGATTTSLIVFVPILRRQKVKPVSNSFKTGHTSEYMRQRDLFIRGRKLYMNELYLNPEIGEYERVVVEAGIDAYNQELLLLDAKKELKLIQA